MGELTPEIMHSIHPSRAGEGGEGCFLRDYRGAFNETTTRNVRSQGSRDGGAFHASVVPWRQRRCTLIDGDPLVRASSPIIVAAARGPASQIRQGIPALVHTPRALTGQPTRDPPRVAPRRSSACITLARFSSRDRAHVYATYDGREESRRRAIKIRRVDQAPAWRWKYGNPDQRTTDAQNTPTLPPLAHSPES